MEEKQFPCPTCGGHMEFDIKNQVICCPYCDEKAELEEREVREFDFNSLPRHPRQDEWTQGTSVVVCKTCGAEVLLGTGPMTLSCDYCGAQMVYEERRDAGIPPEAIIPFQIDRADAQERVATYLRKRFFAPSMLKTLFAQEKMNAHYVPYWTFDADVRCPWRAKGGKTYTVTVGSGDKRRTETRVRWYAVSGIIQHFYDDVLVPAQQNPDPLLSRVDGFQTSKGKGFDLHYLAGYQTEKYDLQPRDAFPRAQGVIEDDLRSKVNAEVLRRYDRVSDVRLSPAYSNVTFKQILMPVWKSAYHYREKLYRVVVNAQNGIVKCQYPKSPWKIAAVTLAALAAAGVILWLMNTYM